PWRTRLRLGPPFELVTSQEKRRSFPLEKRPVVGKAACFSRVGREKQAAFPTTVFPGGYALSTRSAKKQSKPEPPQCPSRAAPGPDPAVVQQVHAPRPSALRGRIREECPRRPGVYGMVDAHGELIYVGKAKSLRARLLTYFRPRSRDPKAGRIVQRTQAIAWE